MHAFAKGFNWVIFVAIGSLVATAALAAEPVKPVKPMKPAKPKVAPKKIGIAEIRRQREKEKNAAAPPPPAKPGAAVIAPKEPARAEKTWFELNRTAPGKLRVSYHNPDGKWLFQTTQRLVLQIYAPAPVVVEPEMVFGSQWPKDSATMELTYKEAPKGKETEIRGVVSYQICHKDKLKDCKREESKLLTSFLE